MRLPQITVTDVRLSVIGGVVNIALGQAYCNITILIACGIAMVFGTYFCNAQLQYFFLDVLSHNCTFCDNLQDWCFFVFLSGDVNFDSLCE